MSMFIGGGPVNAVVPSRGLRIIETMRYFLILRTQPQAALPLTDVLLLRSAIEPHLGSSEIHKMDGPDDADIHSQTVADLIAEGRFSESDFKRYCERFEVPVRHSDGDFNHIASQGFLNLYRGQEIISLSLPTDDSAVDVYAALVAFARNHGLRLISPMPLVQG